MSADVSRFGDTDLDWLAGADVRKFDPNEARDAHGRWTVGSGAASPQGEREVWSGGKETFNNQPNTWKTEKEAVAGFLGRHGVALARGDGVSEKTFVEKAQAADKTLVDLQERFPIFSQGTVEAGYGSSNVKLQELGRIELVAGRSFPSRAKGGDKKAMGSYNKHSQEILLAASLMGRDGALTKNGWTVTGSNLPGTLRHELGHAVDDRFRAIVRNNKGFGIVGDQGGVGNIYQEVKQGAPGKVSMYAMTNGREWFAESFAAYTHPDYGKKGPRINPKLEALFDKVLRNKR